MTTAIWIAIALLTPFWWGVLSQLSAELLKAESLDGGAVREALSSAAHAAV